MNLLFLDWKCFGREDTIAAFAALGHRVHPFSHPAYQERQSSAFLSECLSFLSEKNIDACFSYNYFPVLALACKEADIPYISVTYDSPYVFLYSYTLAFPTNRVFLFDSAEYLFFKNGGLTNVYYQVLPSGDRKLRSLQEKKAPVPQRLKPQVSFCGQLYNEEHTFFDRVTAAGDEYLNGYLEGIVKAQQRVYGYHFVEELLSPEILKRMHDAYPYDPDPSSVEPPAYTYSTYFIDRKITSEERLRLLRAVGERFPDTLSLFTWDKTAALPGVRNEGIAEYDTEMPLLFHHSKINLNISLRSIKTGIPLRCMDIMANGGFLLSNYQADLCRAFTPDEDFVFYEDEHDLLEKIEYYLSHEKERREIADNGRRKTLREYSFEAVLKHVLEISGLS